MGEVPSLNKKMEEFGKKGFSIIAQTNESRATILKHLAQRASANFDYKVAMGGGMRGLTNPTGGIPYGWIIGVDGKKIWEGRPGSIPEKDILLPELKKVRKPTEEEKKARAEHCLAYAESMVTAKRYLKALEVFDGVSKNYAGTEAEKTAAVRFKEISEGAETKADLEAQRALAKMVGGTEHPKEKLKGKECDAVAVKLEGFIKSNKEKAAGAAAEGELWAKVMTEKWKPEK